jgi:hypothetical protein
VQRTLIADGAHVRARREDSMSSFQFFAIITNINSAPKAFGHIDVSFPPAFAGMPVTFNVFDPSTGVEMTSTGSGFTNNVNANGFATSQGTNLFTISQTKTALVKASTPDTPGLSTSTAVLRQRVQSGGKIILGVPATTKPDGTPLQCGTRVAAAVGDFMQGVYLLIANVSSLPVDISIDVGAATAKYQTTTPLPANAVWTLALVAADANSHVVVNAAGGSVLVQLAIDDGKLDEASVLPS